MNNLESAITATRRVELRACVSGACDQGKRPCPSRQACMLPLEEDDDPIVAIKDWVKWIVFAVACGILVCYAASWLMTIPTIAVTVAAV